MDNFFAESHKTEKYFWDWTTWLNQEFLTSCFSEEKVCIPFGLCCSSALHWLIAYFLLIYERCAMKNRNPGDAAAFALYCFLGNLSSTVGAYLSRQLGIQVFMGMFMVALDVVNLIFIIFPLCLSRKSKNDRRMKRMIKKRKRQNLLAMSFLLVAGAGFCLLPETQHRLRDRKHLGRQLLGMFLQDNTEILGYSLGLLSFVIGWTSKFPFLIKANRGKINSINQISYGVLCVLANALYASAILLHDTHLRFVLKMLPWLLTLIGCVAFDILIFMLSCYRKLKPYSHGHQNLHSPDAEFLLGNSSPPCAYGSKMRSDIKRHVSDLIRTPQHVLSSKNKLNMKTEIGHYMNDAQPVRKVCLKEVNISSEDPSRSQPLKRTVKVLRVDSLCSTDASSDTSSVNSALEWDFEDENPRWDKVQQRQTSSEGFPFHGLSNLDQTPAARSSLVSVV